MYDFFFFFPQRLQVAQFVFPLANCQYANRNQLVRRSMLDLNIDAAHGQPDRCPARPTNIDSGLEDIGWVHGLGGESLPAASDGILPNLTKKLFFAIRDGSRFLVICFVHTSGQLFFHHMPGPRPPHVTGHCVNTVTLGWVGAPNERTPPRIQDTVVGFVD